MSEAAAAIATSAPATEAPSNAVSSPGDAPVTEVKKPAAPEILKKVKVAGKEVQLDAQALKRVAEGLGITEEVFLRDYGTSADATRKAQEVAQLRREVESQAAKLREFVEGLKSNPEKLWELAKDYGHDPEKLAEEKLWKKIQYEKMSPEAKEALAAKQRAEAAEQRLKDIEEAEKKKNESLALQQAEEAVTADASEVLKLYGLTSDLKRNAGMARRVAEIYESYILANKAKPSHEYVVQKLRDQRRQEFLEDLNGLEVNEEFINTHKGFVSKLQTYLVNQARNGSLPTHQPSTPAPSTKQAKPKKVPIDKFDELFDDLKS